jgi:hypothetical protein
MPESENPCASPTASLYTEATAPSVVSAAMRTTARGLGMIYFGCVLMLLMSIVGVPVFANCSTGSEVADLLRDLASRGLIFLFALGLIALAFLAGCLMILAGPFFCLATPRESSGRPPLIVSIVFQWSGLGAIVLHMFGLNLTLLDSFVVIAELASSVCFLLFLKSLAGHIARFDLARRVKSVIYVGGLTTIGCVVLVAAIVFRKRQVPEMLAFIDLVWIVVMIAGIRAFIRYFNLINSLRAALLVPPATNAKADKLQSR